MFTVEKTKIRSSFDVPKDTFDSHSEFFAWLGE